MRAGSVNAESAMPDRGYQVPASPAEDPQQEPRGPVDPAVEYEKVCEMAASVRAFRPNMSGEGNGDGDNGVWPDDCPIDIEVEAGVLKNGTPFPMLYWTVDGVRQRIHIPQAFLFHPDTARELKDIDPGPVEGSERSGKIVVVDTGWVAGTHQAADAQSWDIDPLSADVVHEHGPAIVDIIGREGGDGIDVHLRQVRFDLPANGNVPPAIPVFEYEDPDTGEPMLVRGFTDTMLMETLELLAAEAVMNEEGEEELLLQKGDIVNLSLGAAAGPEHLTTPGDVRLYAWLVRMQERGVTVVCAAGNHGTEVPTWPAAHGTNVSPFGQLDNVYAVGSSSSGDSNGRHHFSAHGWVPEWTNGFEVGFDSEYGSEPDAPDACWSGTSFAAPRFAVSLL